MRQAFKFQRMRSGRMKHLDRTINVAAHIWNHAVALHRRYYRLFGKTLSSLPCRSILPGCDEPVFSIGSS